MNIRLANLLSKKLSGEISDMEIRELNSCLTTDPELHHTIQLLELAWENEPGKGFDEVDVNRLLNKLMKDEEVMDKPDKYPEYKIKQFLAVKNPNSLLSRVLPIAAILIIGFTIWWIVKPQQPTGHQKKESLNQIATKPGNRSRVTLRDGTRVWLNSDSKLTYENDFNGQTREVNLSGEAFFDVVSNPDIPFIIHCNMITLKVTGTSFNVRDYPGESKSETSLMSGKLELCLNEDPLQIFYLKPNEKIILKEAETSEITSTNQMGLLKVGNARLIPELSAIWIDPENNRPIESAWVNDQLAFKDESFRDVADKMEKWYNTTIYFNSREIEQLRFTGKFETESLEEALLALQYTAPFIFNIEGKTIYIIKK